MFRKNAQNNLELPPEVTRLNAKERARITRSIQGFQRGEASEGQFLRNAAQIYSEKNSNPAYAECVGHLIREENRHSAYLGRFMREQGIPTRENDRLDAVFRRVRRLAGLELSLRVLVTAELIALTYYDCLGDATRSRNLKAICVRMQLEELQHIPFQMHFIHAMNTRKLLLFEALSNIAHAGLLAATLVYVWAEHRPVLKVKHCFRSFAIAVWNDFREFMDQGRSHDAYAMEKAA
jgi:hypothetical protein